MRSLCFAAAVASLAANAKARYNWGTCPEYQRQPDFDTERYMGTWYSVKKNFLNFFEVGTSCVTQNLKLNEDDTVRIYNRSRRDILGLTSWYGGGMGHGYESLVDGPGSFKFGF